MSEGVTTFDRNEKNAADSVEFYTQEISKLTIDINTDEDRMYDAMDECHNMVLSIDEHKCVDICLGTGGPAAHLQFMIGGGDISSIKFVYKDWFYAREFPMSRGSDEWEAWESFIEIVAGHIVEESLHD